MINKLMIFSHKMIIVMVLVPFKVVELILNKYYSQQQMVQVYKNNTQ